MVNEHQSGITGLPLLDIVIPRMNKKGDGYVLETYTNGIANWPGLRELSIWQSVGYQQVGIESVYDKHFYEVI